MVVLRGRMHVPAACPLLTWAAVRALDRLNNALDGRSKARSGNRAFLVGQKKMILILPLRFWDDWTVHARIRSHVDRDRLQASKRAKRSDPRPNNGSNGHRVSDDSTESGERDAHEQGSKVTNPASLASITHRPAPTPSGS